MVWGSIQLWNGAAAHLLQRRLHRNASSGIFDRSG